MDYKYFKLTIIKGKAQLIFDSLDKINKLSTEAFLELEKILDIINKDKKIKILVFSSAKDTFIVGADIEEIKSIKNEEEAEKKAKKGQEILNKISQLPFPTICFINGACMGGGTELALACQFRVSNDNSKVKIALPEVNLGIIPGFGGTQRLTRLVKLPYALNMILSGKPVDYKSAYKNLLIDDYFREEFQEQQLEKFCQIILKTPEKILIRRKLGCIQRNAFYKKTILSLTEKKLKKKINKEFYPAPFKALKLIQKTFSRSIKQGLAEERKVFAKLAISRVSKNLISLFYAQQELKKSIANIKTDKQKLENISVIGAGVMGSEIAYLFIKNDFNVSLKDLEIRFLKNAYIGIIKIFKTLIKLRKITPKQVNLKIDKLSLENIGDSYHKEDLVIEAIIEDEKIKQDFFKDYQKKIHPDTILASNTSSILINNIAKIIKKPQNFLGIHFFNPVSRMPLVEIIPHKKTSKKVISLVSKTLFSMGKTPIIVNDCAGFLINRILIPYINENIYTLEKLGDIKRIDEVFTNFGMPMGPFTLIDKVGIDVGYKVLNILEDAYDMRMKKCILIDKVFKKNILGKKSGQGFYNYSTNKVNEEIQNFCSREILTDNEILEKPLFIMINEASRCLEENIIDSPSKLDLALIMGTGFPPFRGGLLKYADNLGIEYIVKGLKNFGFKDKRFTPSKYLVNLMDTNTKFYSQT